MKSGGQIAVAFVTSSVSRRAGGVFHCLVDQATALEAAGDANVAVFGLKDAWTDADRTAWRSIDVNAFAPWPPRAFGYAPDLATALLSSNTDVAHLHGLWMYPSLAVRRWHARTGKPVMISPHGMLDDWALQNAAWKKRIARRLFEDGNLRSAACLHALNRAEATSLRALSLDNPIAIIPNGVEPPPLTTPLRATGIAHRRTLLHLGRLHPKKGLLELVRAWQAMKTLAPEIACRWQLVLAGWDDGGHGEVLRKSIAELGLGADVTLPGAVYGAEKTALLEEASAFVLASHSEGLPMAVLEAWAYGLPVFMTAACNLDDGFAARAAIEISREPEALARTLAGRLGDPDLAGYGERGRKLVQDRYTWPRIAKTYAGVYRWLVNGGAAPSCVVVS